MLSVLKQVSGPKPGSITIGLLTATVLAVCLAPVSAQQIVTDRKPNGRTAISSENYSPPKFESRPEVIYGTDDRIDVFQESDPARLQMADSTCGLLDASQLTDNGDGTFAIQTAPYRVGPYDACSGEPFADQPEAMFCSGFLVGPDLIATAGHCYDTSDLSSARFVFGFRMTDSTTAVTTVNEDQVYQGIEVVAQDVDGSTGSDYSVVRVDRVVTAPGAVPLPIRRTGVVANNTAIGVIGHPAGLPTKLAFGPTTQVFNNSPSAFFVANLDTYGGNSGSAVFNANTGIVEGILVRGAQDYEIVGSCFVSNQLSDSSAGGSEGEDVTKTTEIASFVPEVDSFLTFVKGSYPCGGTAHIRLLDSNAGTSTLQVTFSSTAGDSEVVPATQTTGAIYEAQVPLGSEGETVSPNDGVLQGAPADTLTVEYQDASNGSGQPETLASTAEFDCDPPSIENIVFSNVLPNSAVLSFDTTETASAEVAVGSSCAVTPLSFKSSIGMSHQITIDGLNENSVYFYHITAADGAGNETMTNCLAFATASFGPNSLFEDFEPTQPASWLTDSAISSDEWEYVSDNLARSPSHVYLFTPTSSDPRDARLVTPSFSDGDFFEFYHTFDFESGFDGGVIEITTDGGSSWTDLGPYILNGPYNSDISLGTGSPIAGRDVWSGGSFSSMEKVVVDISSFSGSKQVRFRFTADSSVSSGGWMIDDVRAYTVIPPEQLLNATSWRLY